MSAYVVNHKTINFIVTKASQWGVSFYFNEQWTDIKGREQLIASILFKSNVLAVETRYGADADSDTQSEIMFKPTGVDLSTIDLIKCVECLDYQCSEMDNYQNSTCYAILKAIKDRAPSKLPGYDAAPWGLRD